MGEVFHVKLREQTGKRRMRRLRDSGAVPAILYGHGEAPVNLAIANDEVKALLRHGARVVDLEGAVSEKAFIREMQWDTYGIDVLHIDLTRVSADERVTVEVAVDLRGISPGVAEGGVIDHVTHTVEIECLVIAIPEKLILRLTELKLNGHLNASRWLPIPTRLSPPAPRRPGTTKPRARATVRSRKSSVARPAKTKKRARSNEPRCFEASLRQADRPRPCCGRVENCRSNDDSDCQVEFGRCRVSSGSVRGREGLRREL